MNDSATLSTQLKEQEYIDPAMISSSLEFWFTDNEHVRSPFPERIREELATSATATILSWASKISDDTKKEYNDAALAERFEEVLFEIALTLVSDPDEKITMRYPFMPRVGDVINRKDNPEIQGTAIIISRKIEKRGDFAFMVVEHKDEVTGVVVVDEFELPE